MERDKLVAKLMPDVYSQEFDVAKNAAMFIVNVSINGERVL